MNVDPERNPDLLFEQMIETGGDERLDMGPSGANKYHVKPTRYENVFNRGSCTCSPLSPDGFESAYTLFRRLEAGSFEDAKREQADRIKKLINYLGKDEFHVFFAPSGSDLCYFQLMFAKLINPTRNICNIVTCPEELGSGSSAAFHGKHFAGKNQFGEPSDEDTPVSSSIDVACEMLPARDAQGGIINHTAAILDIVRSYYKTHSISANLVIGSKSGIENNIAVVSQVPESVLWTVDLCQFRASRVLINGLLGMNCSVMLTGSKFYQSPPFCAALLVPKTVTNRFKYGDDSIIAQFASIFSRYDVPEELTEIRRCLPDYHNYGLLLRWEAALKEMELLAKLDVFHVNETINEWNRFVVDRLQESDTFELIPGQEVTNKTIVSFRVKSPSGSFLSHEQLLVMYNEICASKVEGLKGYNRMLIGQPVRYGEKSFIRIALGASDLRKFVQNSFDSSNDLSLIRILEDYVRASF